VAGEQPVIPRGVREVGPHESHACDYWGRTHFSPPPPESDVRHGKDYREDEYDDH
jgi:hypothetical protein